MMNCKCNKLFVGILVGVVLPVLMSFILYYVLYKGELDYYHFLLQLIRMGSIGKLLSISVLPNLIVFLIAINLERLLAARGIVTATLVYVMLVLVFKFII